MLDKCFIHLQEHTISRRTLVQHKNCLTHTAHIKLDLLQFLPKKNVNNLVSPLLHLTYRAGGVNDKDLKVSSNLSKCLTVPTPHLILP